ncbi:redoxin domain-containing protein [Candidatus Bipolaricaulota bacterium]|nr:redoxin domain-containing protein [Candidatus Bipolaricaulota bacterium]
MRSVAIARGLLLGLALLMITLSACLGIQDPQAALTAAITSGSAPLESGFNLSCAVVPAGEPFEAVLGFGDGSEPVSAASLFTIVRHTYRIGGVYEAVLIVTDERGRQDQASLMITVSEEGPPVGVMPGMTAPDFTAHTTDGDLVTLSDLRGSVVVLDFWGAWCTPCKKSLPHLQNLLDAYGDEGLLCVLVSTDEIEQDSIEYLADEGFEEFISVWEPGGKRASPITILYEMDDQPIPRSFILDRRGVIRYVGHPTDIGATEIEPLL